MSNEKSKSIWNCMRLSYLNSNINYPICLFTFSASCMYPAKSQMESQFLLLSINVRGRDYTMGRVCVGGHDVTHRRPCWILWSMEVIGKGSAKDSCQSVYTCVNEQKTFLEKYIIFYNTNIYNNMFTPNAAIVPANSGSNNSTHNNQNERNSERCWDRWKAFG